jgi:hypothetical protein
VSVLSWRLIGRRVLSWSLQMLTSACGEIERQSYSSWRRWLHDWVPFSEPAQILNGFTHALSEVGGSAMPRGSAEAFALNLALCSW